MQDRKSLIPHTKINLINWHILYFMSLKLEPFFWLKWKYCSVSSFLSTSIVNHVPITTHCWTKTSLSQTCIPWCHRLQYLFGTQEAMAGKEQHWRGGGCLSCWCRDRTLLHRSRESCCTHHWASSPTLRHRLNAQHSCSCSCPRQYRHLGEELWAQCR